MAFVQVLDLLGPSLWDLWNDNADTMTEQYVACIAMEALVILQNVHEKG